MKPTTTIMYTALLLAVIISISTLVALGPGLSLTHAQTKNETTSSEKAEMSNMTTAAGPSGTIPSMSTPGEKTFYVFTAEVANVDEEKLKLPGDSFSVNTLVVNKGDKVTVHFYNVDEHTTVRHAFTIGDPYKVDIDVGFAGNGEATFTADHSGVFTYYCKYHLPVMAGQLVVLP